MRYVIDKAALLDNAQIVKNIAGPVPVIGVVKGNGYGLGTVNFAKALIDCGISILAVACIEEAQALRTAGVAVPVLLLTPAATQQEAAKILSLDLVATVDSLVSGEILDEAARRKSAKVKAHIKIDTGLGRYGFLPGEEKKILHLYKTSDNIEFTGIYSHFSCSFSPSSASVDRQLNKFSAVVRVLENEGVDCGLRHIANSSAAFKYPATHLDGVRIGSAFLGRLAIDNKYGLKKIGYTECEIAAVKDLPKGHNIGYGDAYRTKKPVRAAVLPVGHTHGFGMEKRKDCYRPRDILRFVFNDAKLLIKKDPILFTVNGKKAPLIGRIGLTHCVIDVTGINCEPGDSVTFEMNPLQVESKVERVFR
jgi:alanine racemase